MIERETLRQVWLMSYLPFVYPRSTPVAIAVLWVFFLILIFISAADAHGEKHFVLTVFGMLSFLVATSYSEQAEERERHRLLWGQLPVSRRRMGWARALGALWLGTLGALVGCSMLAVCYLRCDEGAFEHLGHLGLVALVLVSLRLVKLLVEEVAALFSGWMRPTFAGIALAALIWAVIEWFFPFAVEPLVTPIVGPWAFVGAGIIALGLAALAVEAFVRRPSLADMSPFYQLDQTITRCGR